MSEFLYARCIVVGLLRTVIPDARRFVIAASDKIGRVVGASVGVGYLTKREISALRYPFEELWPQHMHGQEGSEKFVWLQL